MTKWLVVGIGNPDRGDDAVGRVVAARLRARAPAGAAVREHDGEATTLLDWLGDAEAAILIDAALSGEVPGTVQRFDVGTSPVPRGKTFGVSTHGIALADAIELARTLGRLPARCVVYAVEAEDLSPGSPLTPAVARAAADLEPRILEELRGMLAHA